MRLLNIGLTLFLAFVLAACVQQPLPPTAAASIPAGETESCAISEALFTVEADDLVTMLKGAGLTITSFSMSGTGNANTCSPAYSNALHFMHITLEAQDEEKATLGEQLDTLVKIINDWLILVPAWTQSHLDKYNIYMTVTINPGAHQLSKTPAEVLQFTNQGFTGEVLWDTVNQ